MKIPRQTKNAYDPDFASVKFSVRSCVRSKMLMKKPLQTNIQYNTDFGSFNLWKDSQRPSKLMTKTLARSRSEKTQVDQKQIMIHDLPRYFFFALLLTFSHVLMSVLNKELQFEPGFFT